MELKQGGYLERHIEEVKDQDVENKDFGELIDKGIFTYLVADYDNQTEIDYEKEGEKFYSTFTEVPLTSRLEKISQLKDRKKITKSRGEIELIDELISFYNSKNYIIEKFHLVKFNNSLDIEQSRDRLPNLRIILNPDSRIDCCNSFPTGEILVSGDITKIRTIINILHEMGHQLIFESDNPDARERYNVRENITEREGAKILENERNAWAFAIKSIKPFLDKESLDCVLEYCHKYALQGYSDGIRKQIAPSWKLIMTHFEEFLMKI